MTEQLRSKPFTLEEFFYAIAAEAELEKEEILEYYLGDQDKFQITDSSFDIVSCLGYGGSEGIYIDIYLEGYLDGDNVFQRKHCGTVKTLDETDAAMERMGAIGGKIVARGSGFRQKHAMDFCFTGYCVAYEHFRYYTNTLEEARELCKKGGKAIYDLEKRKAVS